MTRRPSYEPGAPIELGQDRIIRVDGEPADIPVTIVQKIWPEQCFVFEASGVPSNTPYRDDPFCIELADHPLPIDVVVALIRVSSPSSSTLVIHKQPYPDDWQVSTVRFQSASFVLINLPQYRGNHSRWVTEDNISRLCGSATIDADPWIIAIDEIGNSDEVMEFFKQERGGRAVTHTGTIVRADGKSFGTEEALSVTTRLETLLSFAAGRRCGIGEVCGQAARGSDQRLLWGTSYAQSWREVRSCFPNNWGFDMITSIGPAMFRLDSASFSVVKRSVGWYVESNVAPAHVGILCTQAALELLASHLTGISKKPMEKLIRDALTQCSVPTSLPKDWPQKRSWDGPRAVVEIRNDFAHANQRHQVTLGEQIRAQELGQWCTEMLLLHMLGYDEGYISRLARPGDPLFPDVPWA